MVMNNEKDLNAILCVECGSKMIWGGNHDCEDGEHLMVSNLNCSNADCGTYMLIYHGLLEKIDSNESIERV